MSVVPATYLSPTDVGKLIGISAATIRRMIQRNEIEAIRMPPGNHYKITPAEVLRYAAAKQIPMGNANRQLLESMIASQDQTVNKSGNG